MTVSMRRLDNWVMEAGSHEREEERDARRFMTESDRAIGCQHKRIASRGPWGYCVTCGERLEI